MIKKVEKSDGIKKDHAVDLAVRAQREKAIGLNNFLAEARVLVNKLPKDDSVRSQCETRNNLVRSELGVINNKVRQYDNELRNRIGRDYSNDGSLFFRSFPTVEGSGWLLSPTSYFLSFAGESLGESGVISDGLEKNYISGEALDPCFTELYEMFLIDFKNSITHELVHKRQMKKRKHLPNLQRRPRQE